MPAILNEPEDAPQGPIPFRPRPPYVAHLTDSLKQLRAAARLAAEVTQQPFEQLVPHERQVLIDLVELVRADLTLPITSAHVPEAHLSAALDLKVEQLIGLVLSSDHTIADLRPILRSELRGVLAEAVALDRAIQGDRRR